MLERKIEAKVTGCAGWRKLEGMAKQALPNVVIVAQNNEGLDTITSARRLPRKIIWFSDLDFGVQSYRLCVSFFCQKPVTRKRLV